MVPAWDKTADRRYRLEFQPVFLPLFFLFVRQTILLCHYLGMTARFVFAWFQLAWRYPGGNGSFFFFKISGVITYQFIILETDYQKLRMD